MASLTDRWWVCQTKPRHERKLAQELSAIGAGHYLPLVKYHRMEGTYPRRADSPLYPLYIFLNGQCAVDWACCSFGTHGKVVRILPVHDNDQSKLTQALLDLEHTLAEQPSLGVRVPSVGDQVKIRHVEWEGWTGRVTAVRKRAKAVLDIVGGRSGVEIELGDLELVN